MTKLFSMIVDKSVLVKDKTEVGKYSCVFNYGLNKSDAPMNNSGYLTSWGIYSPKTTNIHDHSEFYSENFWDF